MPPRSRISARFIDFEDGELGSGSDVLQRLWDQYAEIEVIDVNTLVEFAV